MQHKGLFVALCCGALCLTGCIKNIESESVTKIREATASKLLSEAELNKAQAEAAKIKANAEATIAEAQAKLIEAQAAKEAAEAALILAKKELQEIENEIMKVKLDEEREELKRKKAEVEKQIAEYEAAIAWAAASQQAAINMLENLQAQAEIDAIKNQTELLKREKELAQAAAGLKDELRGRVNVIWTKYSNAVKEYYDAQAQLVKKQADLAKLESEMISEQDIAYEKMMEIRSEIAILTERVQMLEAAATYAAEELDPLIEAARDNLIIAKNQELAARQYYNSALSSWQSYYGASSSLVYTGPWMSDEYDVDGEQITYSNWSDFTSIVNTYKLDGLADTKDERWSVGVVKDGVLMPLFSGYVLDGVAYATAYHTINEDFVEVYPAPEEGMLPMYRDGIYNESFVPAVVYFDNFEQYLTIVENTAWENVAEQKKTAKVDDETIERLETIVANLTGELDAMKTYVDAAKPEFDAARAGIKEAKEAEKTAVQNIVDLAQEVKEYLISINDLTPAQKTEVEKFSAYAIATSILGSDILEVAGFELEVDDLQEQLPVVKEALYQARLTEAAKQKDYNDKTALVTDALKNAVTTAKNNLAAQEGVVASMKQAEEVKLDELHEATIAYTLNPTAETKKDMEDADKDYKEAQAKTETENNKLPALISAVTKAETDLANVQGPADKAEQAWEVAKAAMGNPDDMVIDEEGNGTAYAKYNVVTSDLADAKTQLAEAKKALGHKDDVFNPEEENNSAYAVYNKAEAEYETAKDANPDKDPNLEVFVARFLSGMSAYTAAVEALPEAKNKLYQLDQKYPKYRFDKYEGEYGGEGWVIGGYELQVYPESISPKDPRYPYAHGGHPDVEIPIIDIADMIAGGPKMTVDDEDEPETITVPYLYYQRIQAVEKTIDQKESQAMYYDSIFETLEHRINDIRKHLAAIQDSEADYWAFGEEMDEAWQDVIGTYKDYIDAETAAKKAELIYDMYLGMRDGVIYTDIKLKEDGSEDRDEEGNLQYVEYTINQLDEAIYALTKKIDQLYVDLDREYAKYKNGKKTAGKTQNEECAALEAEIANLENDIQILLAKMESYSAELDTLLTLINEEMEPID